MSKDKIAERLREADLLLRQRRFDLALSLVAEIEEAVAARDADSRPFSRLPTRIRGWVQSIRWAAEVGRQLTYLGQPVTRRRRTSL